VLKVEQIGDPDKLRRVAVLLDREVDRLQRQVADQAFELARLRGETLSQVDFSYPKERLAKALAEAVVEPPVPAPPRPPQPGHGPRQQQQLPIVVRKHELAADERGCRVCGGTVEPMSGQYEDSEEITVTERSYSLVWHRRQKYRCRCNGSVVTAPGLAKLVSGGRYSLDFAVHVAVQKYGDHLPLERQVEVMRRHGLETTSQALWDQLEATAKVLQPSYEALGRFLLSRPLVHVDETGWPVDGKDTGKPRWTAWCLCNEQATWFRIASSKSEAEGRRLLGGYHGTVVADGYRVYKKLAAGGPQGPGYRLAHCWAHVLRKFRGTAENDPRSLSILEQIGELYEAERHIALEARGDPQRHLALRQERLAPLLDRMRAWALAQGGLRRSDFGRAVAYLLSHWAGLTLCLTDPVVPLDNNPAERALRGLVVGRKNHYGSRSQRGADVAAQLYSLVGTAKLCHLDPGSYLRQALEAALREPGKVTLPF
jgi:transposase